jgi:hypothetical protein
LGKVIDFFFGRGRSIGRFVKSKRERRGKGKVDGFIFSNPFHAA